MADFSSRGIDFNLYANYIKTNTLPVACYSTRKIKKMNITIWIIVVIAVLFILFLMWKNLRDEKDVNPDLTDELEKTTGDNNIK